MAVDWPVVLSRLVSGEDLDAVTAGVAMDDIMAGQASGEVVAAFLVALRAKGETAVEVAAAAQAMRDASVPWPGPVIEGGGCDVVGTGGDRSGTVNISTLAAVIVAACGVPVVKHGNRAATSASGAADVLEALGLPLDLSPQDAAGLAREFGLGFAFAPVFHPAMRHAAGVRRALGIPTVFNILGPLTNPARPGTGLIGCADARLAPIMAEVFAGRGDRMLVVRGEDGWDEITPQAPTRVWDATAPDGVVRTGLVEPAALGMAGITGASLAGGTARQNADVLRAALGMGHLRGAAAGTDLVADPAAVATVAIANAAAALAAASGSGGADLTERIGHHLPRARDAVRSGAAADLLEGWIQAARTRAGLDDGRE